MDFSALTVFDMIVIGIVFLSTLIAFYKGFIQSLLSLIVWVGAGLLSVACYPLIEPKAASYFSNPIVARVAAMFVSYIGVLIILGIAAIPISNLARPISRGVIDRTLGMAFGLTRGLAIVIVIFLSIVLSYGMVQGMTGAEGENGAPAPKDYKAPDWIKKSQTYGLLSSASDTTMKMLPDGSYQKAMDSMSSLLPATNKPAAPETLEVGEEGALFKSLKEQATNSDGTVKKEWISGAENAKKVAEEAGYRDDQIQQIDRLIQQVQP
jgi:membrane protein required for colicin V production